MERDVDRSDRTLVTGLLRRAALARQHPLTFFDFTWRDELTKERVQALPHQRVFFKFTYDHPLCCVRMSPGFSKTTCMLATGLFNLGNDVTSRGAFIGATVDIAKKPVGSMLEIIENMDEIFPEMRLVFPELKQTARPDDPWSSLKFTVDRTPGIRDASVAAFGIGGSSIIGSRLAWIGVDDVLTLENTLTKEQRDFTKQWLMQIVLGRLDPNDGRCVVTNVPYDDDDLTYYLQRSSKKNGAGWPTLELDAYGSIRIWNADDWDCEEIRPSAKEPNAFRLVDHDSQDYGAKLYTFGEVRSFVPFDAKPTEIVAVDVDEEVPLWPKRFPRSKLDAIEGDDNTSQVVHDRNYRMKTGAASNERCKAEWIERCKELARLVGHHTTLDRWDGREGFLVTTGIDIGGLGLKKEQDSSCIFTHATILSPIETQAIDKRGTRVVLRAGTRIILDIEYGKWRSKELIEKIIRKLRAYGSRGRIEVNAERSLREWSEDIDASIPLSPHDTGMNKHHQVWGVESVFTAMAKGLWLIPNVDGHIANEHVERWVEALKTYTPHAHTDDGIMAAWFAKEEERSIWVPPLENMPAIATGAGISLFAR